MIFVIIHSYALCNEISSVNKFFSKVAVYNFLYAQLGDQVQQREQENPYQIDQMPVECPIFLQQVMF